MLDYVQTGKERGKNKFVSRGMVTFSRACEPPHANEFYFVWQTPKGFFSSKLRLFVVYASVLFVSHPQV